MAKLGKIVLVSDGIPAEGYSQSWDWVLNFEQRWSGKIG